MQIVIDIDTVDYEYIKNGCIIPIEIDNHIYDAIRKGTPLPKGHGDLIDRSEVEKLYDKLCNTECDCCALDGCFYDKARTIIEADKAESEG